MRQPDDLHDYQKKAVNFQCTKPFSALFLDAGLGKLQPNSEPVLTPTGWKPIGELKVGDYVIGSQGKSIKVLGVFQQGDCEIVNVEFSDGSSTRVGWDHLWYVTNSNRNKRHQKGDVMTTKEIFNNGLTRNSGKNREVFWWHIPLVKPVEFDSIVLPLDPYTLGVILGDGTINEFGGATICTDIEIINNIECNFLRHHESDGIGYASIHNITKIIQSLGLQKKRSWEKFIPELYLRGSVEQRLALLQGLLDTDGSPIDKGGVEYTSTSEALIDGVIELTQSLGGIARNKTSRFTYHQGGMGRKSWRVNVKLPSVMTPFRLQRKINRWVRPTKYQPIRKIVGITVVGNEQSTCIKVDAVDSLYVTKDYIVTHNTSVTLTSITHLLNTGYLKAVVVVAPPRVCKLVWRQEALKWSHTQHLKFAMLTGNKDQRSRALLQPAQVYLINYENLGWLSEALQTYFKDRELPFDGIVFDELSKMKNSTTQRVKSLKKVLPQLKWKTGLTGTPASNGYKDLHGQFLVLDGGERLGLYKTQFEHRFYKKYKNTKMKPYPDTEDIIKRLISDITINMSAEDYLKMPDLITNDVIVELPDQYRRMYDELEKEFFVKLDSGTELELFNKAGLTNKCLQFSSGAVYPVSGLPVWEHVHNVKLDALEDIIDESNGQPILCFYGFRSEAERMMTRFKDINPINLTACKSEKDLNNAMNRWKNNDCQLMLAHPKSAAHGIDGLQHNGHIMVWTSLTWSLDEEIQAVGRLQRQGQGVPVICHRIIMKDTFDEAQALALKEKATNQTSLRKAIQEYRNSKYG